MSNEQANANTAPEIPGSAQGQGGPNPTPTFGKKDFESENFNRLDQSTMDSIKEGAEAHTQRNPVDVDGLIAAGGAGDEPEDGSVQYASPSIARLKIGPYQFENGRIKVPANKVEHFESVLSSATARTQQAVRKIDREAGEAVARRFLEQTKGKRTSGVDTTANTEGSQPNPANQLPKPPVTPVA